MQTKNTKRALAMLDNLAMLVRHPLATSLDIGWWKVTKPEQHMEAGHNLRTHAGAMRCTPALANHRAPLHPVGDSQVGPTLMKPPMATFNSPTPSLIFLRLLRTAVCDSRLTSLGDTRSRQVSDFQELRDYTGNYQGSETSRSTIRSNFNFSVMLFQGCFAARHSISHPWSRLDRLSQSLCMRSSPLI